ncbi:hypothetical protein RND81_03G183500 [Saponaria officinalis]|uniref:Transducin/WD40 repeat-like superfamily protein n=1 Tax=Saponaria officinalis TaxID=3572 RepID=A0AAW1M729_SAPOF
MSSAPGFIYTSSAQTFLRHFLATYTLYLSLQSHNYSIHILHSFASYSTLISLASNLRIKRNMAEFQFQTDELEFIDDYYSTTDFDDESLAFSDNLSSGDGVDGGKDDSFLPDFEDDFDLLHIGKSKTDTTAGEARKGKDIQGIPWERLNFTRDKYRQTRLKLYKNFHSLPSSSSYDHLHKDCKQVEKGHNFYNFQFNTRLVKSTIVHFQLRNLLWATSKHDVYLMQNYSVMHWSALRKSVKEVLNVAKPIVPTASPRSFPLPLSRVQISTMSVKDNLLVAGGFHGELICKHLNEPGVAFSTKVTTDENAITNAVDIAESSSGSKWVIAANNDAHVRVFDATSFVCLNRFSFPWSVNNTSMSPDGKLMAVLGDSADCLVSDSNTGKVISTLQGHLDYSFSSAWHPDGRILATGNQDTTCRLWDIRNTSQSLDVLKGRMGAIRALKFTSDGRFLAMAEPADFVHIFDSHSGYKKVQEIDLFGEIGGISFSPDTEALFVGVADRTYGSVLEFNRSHQMGYLEAIF